LVFTITFTLMNKYLFSGLLLLSFIISSGQQRVQFLPIKEKITDTSLTTFIDTLKAIVQRKDAKKIYTLLDSKIVNRPTNSDEGIRYFRKYWQPEKKNNLWKTLQQLLAWGGKYNSIHHKEDKNEFVYPYFIYETIKDGAIEMDYFVTNDKDITMYKTANAKSEIITKLSYEAVTLIYDSTKKSINPNWENVQTVNNQCKGFVEKKYLYSFFNYHMYIHKEKEKWKITGLTEGS
jgi:hypothetical protein